MEIEQMFYPEARMYISKNFGFCLFSAIVLSYIEELLTNTDYEFTESDSKNGLIPFYKIIGHKSAEFVELSDNIVKTIKKEKNGSIDIEVKTMITNTLYAIKSDLIKLQIKNINKYISPEEESKKYINELSTEELVQSLANMTKCTIQLKGKEEFKCKPSKVGPYSFKMRFAYVGKKVLHLFKKFNKSESKEQYLEMKIEENKKIEDDIKRSKKNIEKEIQKSYKDRDKKLDNNIKIRNKHAKDVTLILKKIQEESLIEL